MNRRIDPESAGVVHWPHIWRCLRVQSLCMATPGAPWTNAKNEWSDDVGYCLDRYSTLAELAEETARRNAIE